MGATPRSFSYLAIGAPPENRPAAVGARSAALFGAYSRGPVARRILRFQPPSFVVDEACRPFRHAKILVLLMSKFKRERHRLMATKRATVRMVPDVDRRTAAKPFRRRLAQCRRRTERVAPTRLLRRRSRFGSRSPARRERCSARSPTMRPQRTRRVRFVDNAPAIRCRSSSVQLCARRSPTSLRAPRFRCRARRRYISSSQAPRAAESARAGRATSTTASTICSSDSPDCLEASRAVLR